MSKFVVIVFPGESQAYQGTRALKELHAEGSLTLYGMAVISKDAQGSLSVKEAADAGPLGTAVGALVGGLVGVIGGPAGVLAGAAGGTVIGSFVDLFGYGVGADFVSKVSTELRPGKTAIVAEIAEYWTTPLDTRMQSLTALSCAPGAPTSKTSRSTKRLRRATPTWSSCALNTRRRAQRPRRSSKQKWSRQRRNSSRRKSESRTGSTRWKKKRTPRSPRWSSRSPRRKQMRGRKSSSVWQRREPTTRPDPPS